MAIYMYHCAFSGTQATNARANVLWDHSRIACDSTLVLALGSSHVFLFFSFHDGRPREPYGPGLDKVTRSMAQLRMKHLHAIGC